MAPPMRRGKFILDRQAGGGVYQGIEQPDSIMAGLQRSGQLTLPDDPLGVGVQARGMEHRQAYDAAEREKNPYRNTGPLPDPSWEGFQQALGEAGVTHIRGGNIPGSHQLVGTSTQPDYFTQDATFQGRPNLNSQTQPMPESQESFERRMKLKFYGPAIAGLTQAGY